MIAIGVLRLCPLQKADQRVKNWGYISLAKGLNGVAVGKVADDQPQHTFAVARVARIAVDPKFLRAFTALEIGAISHLKLPGFGQPLGHPVEEGFHREDATGVRLPADVSHQVLVILVKFAHDWSASFSVSRTVPQSVRNGMQAERARA